jgi:hypothetical protein
MNRFLAVLGGWLVRSVVIGAVALAVLVVPLWAASMFSSVGIFSLGNGANVRFFRGTAEVHRVYERDIAPAVPHAQWHDHAVARGWTVPPGPRGWVAAGVHFSSGHVMGIGGPGVPLTVAPARYWILRLPLWPLALPGVVAGGLLVARWGNRRQGRRRGFAVETRAHGA